MRVSILTIGDEILIGQIVDTNSSWIANELSKVGGDVVQMLTISDEGEAIQQALQQAMQIADVVIMTGGLGPTRDDITKHKIAEFFGAEMVFHQPTHDHIQALMKKWSRSTPDYLDKQCAMPDNATVLTNAMGTAPGMWFEEENTIIVSMPGVPYEMQYIMETHVIPKLAAQNKHFHIAQKTLLFSGLGESMIAKQISDIEDNLPTALSMAYLPSPARVRIRLTAKGNDKQHLTTLIEETAQQIIERLEKYHFGYNEDTMSSVLGKLLIDNNLTIATAESCTGGLIAHSIVLPAGASAYYAGSIVAYQNEIKQEALNVSAATIAQHGAVSEETVIEMARGVIKKLGSDIGIATSGIAGPGGGTASKPVGTVWICVMHKDETFETAKLQLSKNREKNMVYSANYALNLARMFVTQNINKA